MEVESEWDKATFLEKWFFSVPNKLLALGMEKPLQFDDLLHISKRDCSGLMMQTLKYHYKNSTHIWFMPRLMVALFKSQSYAAFLSAFYTMFEYACSVVAPLLLRYFLIALEESASDRECYMWAALLSANGLLLVLIHHVNFFFSMRMGWNWKSAVTAFIQERLILLDSGAMQRSGTGTGMLVNLISNDVARFEEFAVVSFYL